MGVPMLLRSRALLAACGAITCWSFFALMARFVDGVPPLQLAAMGFTVAAVAGFVFLACRGELRALQQPPIAWLHGVGGLFGFHALYFSALQLAPPTQATIINYSWPLLSVLLAAKVLRLRLRQNHLLGVALGLTGCLMLAGHAGPIRSIYLLGYICAVLSAVVWAVYSAFASKLRFVPTEAMVGFYGATAALSWIAHLLFETTAHPSWQSLIVIIALGLGPLGLAYFLWDYGVKRGDPRLLGTFGYVTPVASYLLLGAAGFAPVGPIAIIAAAMVAAGGVIAARTPSSSRLPPV